MKPTQGYNKCICRIGDKNAFPERLVSEPMRLDSSPASAAAELSVLFMKIFFIRIKHTDSRKLTSLCPILILMCLALS